MSENKYFKSSDQKKYEKSSWDRGENSSGNSLACQSSSISYIKSGTTFFNQKPSDNAAAYARYASGNFEDQPRPKSFVGPTHTSPIFQRKNYGKESK